MLRVAVASGVLALSVVTISRAQDLTPRDAFWSASDLVSVASNPGAKASGKAPRPAASVAKSSGSAATRPRDTRASAQQIAENGYGEQPHLVRTSLKTQQLGLRYSILKQQLDGSFVESLADETFHEGDSLRLSIMSNEPGYLYVIHQGSSGNWAPIFPDTRSGSNRVEAGVPYQIPGDPQKFRFDNRPGTEKLFVVLSREPIADLAGAVDRLKNSPAPASSPSQSPDAGQLLEASNHISDALVQRFASRDLTLVTEQKVEDTAKPSNAGEKAVYVVAKQDSQSPAHEIVTRITLNHR